MKQRYLIAIVIFIFIFSVAVRYWPVYHKGFSFGMDTGNLILARNLSLTGEYKIDNKKNVILSSVLIKAEGIPATTENQLTPILYSKIFNLFGFNQNIPLWISLVLYSFISVLFFLLVLKLINIWVALIFSFVEIFAPLVIKQAIQPGTHEWAVFFLAIALFVYLYREKPNFLRLFLAGLFFALAIFARNSFLLSFIPFLIYDFIKNKSFIRLGIFILPFVLILGIYWGPTLVKGEGIQNVYVGSRKAETSTIYMHLFPDSYTWHFERDAYVENIKGTSNYDYNQFLAKYGYHVSLKNKILMYWASIKSYPEGLIAQTTIGGPFLLFFLILGAGYLYRTKKNLLILFILWAGILYLGLIIVASNHWGHFISVQFPIFLLISLGIYLVSRFILRQDIKEYLKYILIFGFLIALFFHLMQSDKWAFHEEYLYSKMGDNLELVEIIKEKKDKISPKSDIIAMGLNSQAPAIVNWYTDFNCVYFAPDTIKKLLKENKLQWAFEQFGITRVTGYDRDLTKEIIEATKVEEI